VNILERTGPTSEDDADDVSPNAAVDDQLTVAVVAAGATPGAWAIVAAHGEIDIASAPSLREALDTVTDPGARVILDLSGVSFMDSTGLSVLISAYKRLVDAGGELRTVVSSGRIRTLLEITKLSGVLPLFGSVAEAQAGTAESAS
jgi:anti-sigma B factor antagonist